MTRVLVIDNYDSFTWNLVHLIGPLVSTVEVVRNDATTVDAVLTAAPDAIVLSPGPCTPNEAGICLDLVERAGADDPDIRRLPRAAGHRTGFRRHRRARAPADARQGLGGRASRRAASSAASTALAAPRATIR